MRIYTHRGARVTAAFILGLAILGLAAGPAGARPSRGRASQTAACRWERLPVSLPQAVYFTGAAWDSGNQRLLLNGGLDAADSTKRVVQALDLSSADPAKATARLLTPTGPVQDFWGTAGAFRATSPSPDASAALFWGGGEGPGSAGSEGTGKKILQTYVPKSNVWTTTSVGTAGVVLAAGAFDAGKDLAVFVGGVKRCDFFAVTAGSPLACSDAQNQVTFVRFDPTTGGPLAQVGPTAGGPGRVQGGSLVMDTVGQRMLYFGGVDDAGSGRARNTTFALDLTDPDPARAHWAQLAVSGQLPPARAFHGAAYDAGRNWMVVYGGAAQGLFTSSESALTDTWALDLGQAPPRWLNLGANTPGQRVGAGMAFAANHGAAVLAGGRRAYAAGQQNVARDAYLLNCGAGPAATNTPPGPGATPTLPPPITAPPPGTPSPTAPPPAAGAQACPQLTAWRLAPDAVIADALANPGRYFGWQQPNNPAIAPGPYNPVRRFLSLAAPGKPYHPLFNTLVWKAGCP
jgi:hypothetical protein